MRPVVRKYENNRTAADDVHPALETYTFERRGVTIRNRTVLAAMTNKQSHDDGTLSDDEIAWLEARSRGGFGIVTTAATHVLERGQGWDGEFGTWSDGHVEGLTELSARVKREGAVLLAQLFHGGMRAPKTITGVQPVSASTNPLGSGLGDSEEMTASQIQETIGAFGQAARRCEEAGFDGVELHGAHGYLIAQFLGGKTNRRTDEWGGDQKTRTRFLVAITEEVRRCTGPNFLVGIRLSPELTSCGMTIDDAVTVATICGELDIDFLHLSCWDIRKEGTFLGETKPFTTIFREATPAHLPLFTTGGIWTAADARLAMKQGGDLVGVGRAGIPHADWPSYLEAGSKEPSRPPFTPTRLKKAMLNPTFIEYMRRWEGFVAQ